MTRNACRLAACLVATFALTGAAATAEGPEDAAQAVADSWLRLVDGGNYAASWSQAAAALKRGINQDAWSEKAAATRGPLGALSSRKLKSREYTEKAPTTRTIGGAVYTFGEGKYVVIQYDSAFANKASAAEGVIVAQEGGAWRVAGYSIR
jgi:hypothetical protein